MRTALGQCNGYEVSRRSKQMTNVSCREQNSSPGLPKKILPFLRIRPRLPRRAIRSSAPSTRPRTQSLGAALSRCRRNTAVVLAVFISLSYLDTTIGFTIMLADTFSCVAKSPDRAPRAAVERRARGRWRGNTFRELRLGQLQPSEGRRPLQGDSGRSLLLDRFVVPQLYDRGSSRSVGLGGDRYVDSAPGWLDKCK